ncbi:sensor histidine kinase [Tahibacter amnicola]|uniref:histidine kinase n=1 Tax=Tahibacter amnicola TaxID=2976241 RepID=A0ABY6BE48_9GAMM|nr:sensor histidine kinase [Tahibacter amnicola]UXI68085.1 sensor histidine kinase [Tahibacter amnicola]
MAQRRPLSLQARSTLAAGMALAAFLGVTGFALDQAYYDAAVAGMRDRLQSYVYAYLAGSDVLRGTKLLPPETLPDPEFNRPGSGLYAVIIGEAPTLHWESPSALGRELAFDSRLAVGETRFDGPIDNSVGRVFVFSQGVSWEVDERKPVTLTVHVAESEQQFHRQVAAFRRTLARWLGALAVVLLLLQIALLRWGLSPLRRMVRDVDDVMNGDAERLPGLYPMELTPLTESLNELIDFGREQLDRYRNTMSDLAHSLKTPLAVLRSELDSERGYDSLRNTVADQSQRMHDIVSYQLSRATASRHQVFSTPLAIEQAAEGIVGSLEKVYAAKRILCEFEIDPDARFYGSQGDLMELLGNLLENAFKWASRRVTLTAHVVKAPRMRRAGLELRVEDDGPGIPPEKVEHLLQRGVRGDERVQGHGIGLAIVQDIIKGYRGTLAVHRSDALGGAAFVVRFEAA